MPLNQGGTIPICRLDALLRLMKRGDGSKVWGFRTAQDWGYLQHLCSSLDGGVGIINAEILAG